MSISRLFSCKDFFEIGVHCFVFARGKEKLSELRIIDRLLEKIRIDHFQDLRHRMMSDLFYLVQDLYYTENILNEYKKKNGTKKGKSGGSFLILAGKRFSKVCVSPI